jgi:hypothetical protein
MDKKVRKEKIKKRIISIIEEIASTKATLENLKENKQDFLEEYFIEGHQDDEFMRWLYWGKYCSATFLRDCLYKANNKKIKFEDVMAVDGTCQCSRCGDEIPVVFKSLTNFESKINYRKCDACLEIEKGIKEKKEIQYAAMQAQITAEIKQLIEMPYSQYLQTEHWQRVRKSALKKAHYKCQLCHGGGTLNVHHKTYEYRGQEHRVYDNGLIVLCKTCHDKFHDKLLSD